MTYRDIKEHILHNLVLLKDRGLKDIKNDAPNLLYGSEKLTRREIDMLVTIDTVPVINLTQMSRLFYVTPERMQQLLIKLNTKLTTANSRYMRSKDIFNETNVIEKLVKYMRLFDSIYESDWLSGNTVNEILRRYKLNRKGSELKRSSIDLIHKIQFGEILSIADAAEYLSVSRKTAETRIEKINMKVEEILMIFIQRKIIGTPFEVYVRPTRLDDKPMTAEEMIESLQIFTDFENNYRTLNLLRDTSNYNIKK